MNRFSRHQQEHGNDRSDHFQHGHQRNGHSSHNTAKFAKFDDPPHSRLFIVCGRSLTEDDFRENFSKFGEIEDFWMVKDKSTEEFKGICYIKFSKTSEAALAMEEMNGQTIGNHLRPLKVMVAHSRDQGSRRDANEEERLVRLFVVIPKSIGEKELREHFSQFGNIQYASIVKDKVTKENKGYGYVKYEKMSEAAKAFECCDSHFKPVFAEPRPQNKEGSDMGGRGAMEVHQDSRHASDHFTPAGGMTRLTVFASPELNQNQLWRLFDLIPGLECCELRKDRKPSMGQGHRAHAAVAYSSAQSAAYALEKLNGFEYPPGQRLVVRPDTWGDQPPRGPPQAGPGLLGAGGGRGGADISQIPDISTLVETIAQASSLIQAAGLLPGSSTAPLLLGGSPAQEPHDPYYCSVSLPPKQPLAPVDSEVAERLFIVCHHGPPPPMAVMKDVFGRFGSLIDVYMLNGKNFGYAKYACRDSAEKAILEMHGQDIMGARLKVMRAEPHDKNDGARKRIRME